MMKKQDQYGLGGFLKKVGKAALPLASLLPIPGAGIAAGIVGGLVDRGGKKAQDTPQAPQGDTNAILQQLLDAINNQGTTLPQTKEKPMRPTALGSLGFQMRSGGAVPIGKGAVKFEGPSHEQGGIQITPNAEVEGGETMEFLPTKRGVSRKGVPYVFSAHLKVPETGVSFAKTHESLLKRGARDEDRLALADLQERTSGRAKPQEDGKLLLGGLLSTVGKAAKGLHNSGILDEIGTIAPGLLNLGRGLFGKTDAPQQSMISGEPISGIDRSAFGEIENTALNELGQFSPLKLDASAGIARNNAALRTVGRGASSVARLAALGSNRRGNLELTSNLANQESVTNFEGLQRHKAQRAQLASRFDLANANRETQLALTDQQTKQFNAQQALGIAQANSNIGFRNQTGKAQAVANKQTMLNEGFTNISDYLQSRKDSKNQKAGIQQALEALKAGSYDISVEQLKTLLDL